ncbi:hypothetical protein ABZV34_26875 [Streptomyces sp. NPDC005195]|uniref:hypothetical protein n=1 Tax=Streptomyces sp. NPDC005195 TaxID=3154561 RepID=UPI0033A4AEE1
MDHVLSAALPGRAGDRPPAGSDARRGGGDLGDAWGVRRRVRHRLPVRPAERTGGPARVHRAPHPWDQHTLVGEGRRGPDAVE